MIAAEKVTPEAVNFLSRHGRGLICLAATRERMQALDLRPMVADNRAAMGTAFTVSVDAASRHHDGNLRARSRADGARSSSSPARARPISVRPGHLFPLEARPGGVLQRAGHTEAVVDLCRAAGLQPAGLLCEILDEDGSMARGAAAAPDRGRLRPADGLDRRPDRLPPPPREAGVARRGDRSADPVRRLPRRGLHDHRRRQRCTSRWSRDASTPMTADARPRALRVLTGDLFHSLRCDCGDQLEAALAAIEARGSGVFLYMRQEGRGHRPAEQAQGLRAPGRGRGHRRRERAPRLRGRPPRVRRGRADPARPRRAPDGADHQQPAQDRRTRRAMASRS